VLISVLISTQFEFENRLWGRRLIPNLVYYQSGKKTAPADDEILRRGKWGVHEVTDSGGGSLFYVKGKGQFAVQYRDKKRWFNLSRIVNSYRQGKTPVHLQRSRPFISPTGGFYNVDPTGHEIDPEGDTIIDVPLDVDDLHVFRDFVLQNGDKQVGVKTLLDTGFKECQVSASVAQKLGLYNKPNLQNGGEIEVDDGGSYEVYKTTVTAIVFIQELLRDDLNRNSISKDHY